MGIFSNKVPLFLKLTAESLDPILRRYTTNENLERCLKEFQILTSLKRVGFPVPKAFFYESDLNFFGSPFIVMEKEELSQNFSNNMDQFAKNLVWLHRLDINTLSIGTLKSPEGRLDLQSGVFFTLRDF